VRVEQGWLDGGVESLAVLLLHPSQRSHSTEGDQSLRIFAALDQDEDSLVRRGEERREERSEEREERSEERRGARSERGERGA
jgi:hypothetical protein